MMVHVYLDDIEIKIGDVTFGQDNCITVDGHMLLMDWVVYHKKLHIIEFWKC